jgi:plastocyanin
MTSRRGFLKAAAATSAAAVGGGAVVAAQDAQQGMAQVRLGGKVAGWQGVKPQSIKGETNPTLQFVAGQQVEVTWKNLDGQPHNFRVFDGNNNTLVDSKIMSEQGATQTVTFTAKKEMVEYDCELHPSTMVGDVSVSAGQQKSQSDMAGNKTNATNKSEAERIPDTNETQGNLSANETQGNLSSHVAGNPPQFNVTGQQTPTQQRQNGTQRPQGGGQGQSPTPAMPSGGVPEDSLSEDDVTILRLFIKLVKILTGTDQGSRG